MTTFVTMATTKDKLSPTVLVPIGIVIVILIIVAVFGNTLTILSFIKDKRLRNVYNTYIVNLAITDLLIAIISMFFYAIYTLKSEVWILGEKFCKVFLLVDFTLCAESVLMICIISYDRLLLLKRGPYYTKKETKRVARVKIVISWAVAFLLYGPAVIGWDHWTGVDIVADDDCDVQFAHNFEFTTIAAICEFVLPLTALIIINSLIFREIRKRIRLTAKQLPKDIETKNNIFINVLPMASMSQQDSCDSDSKDNKTSNSATSSCDTLDRLDDVTISRRHKHHIKMKRYIKAAKFLAALVTVFVVTWCPYTIATVIIAFCESCVNVEAYEVMTWLLWSKASVDPFLYALNSKRFQRNFIQILTFGKHRQFGAKCSKRNNSATKSSTFTDHS